ncbi:protein lifeguard 3-like [Megalops cyprinoides]|uniref:protein lifeguard 3-like n=1 Tax=Megalops cyprinoides TaxID=118141 RepID=UPI001863BADA|nr:protein lifeguard 3-like [Megalops cyprinoides]
MSKSDFPPGYDDSRSPLYGPQGGGYPQPPPYGFPAFGGQPQPGLNPQGPGMYPGPQPSAPYPGQPGMYPPGQGYPAPSMPPMMPPVMPPVMPTPPSDTSGDAEGFAAPGGWDSLSVRHAFIRKVYLILSIQLFVTVGLVAVFTFVKPVKGFVRENPGVYWASFAVYLVTHIVLVCCKGPRRRFPWNIILLAIFTLAMSYMTGTISSYYDTKAVFLALVITVVVCVIVSVFCFQTKVDFTSCGGLFCVLGIVVMVTGIIATIVLSIKYIPWLHMVYAAIGAIVYTLFLAYHTQLLIGNRKHSISPEEYVFGALSLYVDIVQIFLFLLQIIGAASK